MRLIHSIELSRCVNTAASFDYMTWLAAHVCQAGDAASLRDHFSLGRCFKWAYDEGWQLLRVREEEAARQITFALAAPNVPTSLKFRLEALSASFEKSHVRRFATAILYHQASTSVAHIVCLARRHWLLCDAKNATAAQ
jgi:hypothetical protein